MSSLKHSSESLPKVTKSNENSMSPKAGFKIPKMMLVASPKDYRTIDLQGKM